MPVYANPRKAVPLPDAQPVTLHVPRDGRLIQWKPKVRPRHPAPSVPEHSAASVPSTL